MTDVPGVFVAGDAGRGGLADRVGDRRGPVGRRRGRRVPDRVNPICRRRCHPAALPLSVRLIAAIHVPVSGLEG